MKGVSYTAQLPMKSDQLAEAGRLVENGKRKSSLQLQQGENIIEKSKLACWLNYLKVIIL